MIKRNLPWVIAAGTCLTVTMTGAPVAMADDEAQAVGHGFHTGTVSLSTTHDGQTYELKDPNRGNTRSYRDRYTSGSVESVLYTDEDNDWGDGSLSDRVSMAVDAQYAAAKAWDYFANVHGRKGFAGDGKGLELHGRDPGMGDSGPPIFGKLAADKPARIRYGSPYNMFGIKGGARQVNPNTLDQVGAAVAMGVAHTAAGLPRSYGETDEEDQAFAISLTTARIFGTMIEFYANNRVDRPDYLIGERLAAGFPAGTFSAPKSMANPSQGCLSKKAQTTEDPGIHFFHLLAVGSNPTAGEDSPTCNSMPVTGIGNDKAAKIWYRALTEYFTSKTNYVAARVATLKAAADLYGAHGLEYNTVNAAWAAVLVGGANPIAGGKTPYPVNPGDQETVVRTAARLQLEATNPGGRALTYTAAGLPPGLTVDPESGLISGTPTKAGDYRVTVGTTDTLHAQGTTWFMWYVA
ncbi:M4 family metallopeptidase [Nonomuraea sp. NPDC049709]|uniref:M4 family metallopeptidase n=1 Tax=Nonomuraea sp. NPDC049709 TaxID=3154736 RepID=UPI0034350FB3